jgi:epsilon-lactone hydrolase
LTTKIHFYGPLRYRLGSSAAVSRSLVEASARRLVEGPRLPGWNWSIEVGTEILRRQLRVAFRLRDIAATRRYLDSLVIGQPLPEVGISPVSHAHVRGSWFATKDRHPRTTLLYFHGGGYAFYPKGYAHLIQRITLAAKSKTFALDYRLTPEHRFPAQLEDALNAYRWLLQNGARPDTLVLGGDSAGGNLTLALLVAARERKLPLPAFAFALSPPTDFDPERAGVIRNQPFDWIQGRMLEQWADWFCDREQRGDPLISPVRADLSGLPPIYIQAGRSEILYDTIRAFADCAREQKAPVVLESWEEMNHVFQIFAPDVPQSMTALRRLGEVIDSRFAERRL